jgi:TRAP-type uncharacterized transport system substrate-binding protein
MSTSIAPSPLEVRLLGAGQNWMPVCGAIANGLSGYYSALPSGSCASVTTFEPGSACFSGPELTAGGRFDIGMTTPAWLAELAVAGAPPFAEPLKLRALAVLPHNDRLVLSVRKTTGITSITQIAEEKRPLRISTPLRETRHPGVWFTERVLELHGFDFDDIEAWGGKILRNRPKNIDAGSGTVAISPDCDAVFDEAIMTRRWSRIADEAAMTYLPIDPPIADLIRERGWPVGTLNAGALPGLERDIQTLDLSGWLIYCREDLDEEIAYLTIRALDEQQGTINGWFSSPTMGLTSKMDLAQVGRDTPIPLHAGADRYYREHGYL